VPPDSFAAARRLLRRSVGAGACAIDPVRARLRRSPIAVGRMLQFGPASNAARRDAPCATLPVDLPGFTADSFPRLLPISDPTRCPSSGAVEMTSLPVRVSHQPALASLSPWRRCARPFPHSSSRRCSI